MMLTLDISLPNGVITKPCSFEVKKKTETYRMDKRQSLEEFD